VLAEFKTESNLLNRRLCYGRESELSDDAKQPLSIDSN